MNIDTSIFNDPNTLYKQLKDGCMDDWHAYCHDPFVEGLANGTLPQESFRHYLQQDYLFLIHFSRAYALAVVKADNLNDMRAASSSVDSLLNTEMRLHMDYCTQWGLTEQDVINQPEAMATMAYTRYVLERGMSGDILDLYTALSPCAVGYAEIGHRLINDPATRRKDNPYWQWIETYGGDDYIAAAIKQIQTLDALAKSRFNPVRLESLRKTFREASRLEISFWAMGFNCSR